MVFCANTYAGWFFSIPLSLVSLQRLFQTFTVMQLCHCTNTKLHVTNIQAHHQWYNYQAKTEHYENILRKMMMVLTSFFYWMFGQQNMLSLISSWNHYRRLSPMQISNTLWAGFAFAQNLRSEFVESSCTEMISTTPSCYCTTALQYISKNISPCFSSAPYRC